MSPERDRAREPLVRVATAENPATADMLLDALKHAGIPAMSKNVDPLQAYGLALPFTQEIFVLEGDAAAAEAVLGFSRPAPKRLRAPLRRLRPRRRAPKRE